jgi:guanine deaminase
MQAEFMAEAIALAKQGMNAGLGGPFGALIVRSGEVIGRACNDVIALQDPTAHAEIQAIRRACKNLSCFHLEGCVLYCSCEPCPMCLAAAYWARLEGIYFAASREDAARMGFADARIYAELGLAPNERQIPMVQFMQEEALKVAQCWKEKSDRVLY